MILEMKDRLRGTVVAAITVALCSGMLVHSGSVAAQSAPTPAGPPVTAPQPGDVSCGTDMNCFATQATCTPSGVTYTATLDLAPLLGLTSGFESSTTDLMRVSPDAPGSSSCRLAFVVQSVDVHLLPKAAAELTANGVSQDAIETLRAGMADSNRELDGRWGACVFAPNDLALMLGNWSRGNFSTDDFSSGSCNGTYFGD